MTRIYIANLGKYNEGELVGEWVDLPVTEEELEEVYIRIKVAHRDEDGEFVPYYMEYGITYEETAIHDYDSDMGVTAGEWDDVMKLSELVEELEGLSEYELEIVKAYRECYDDDLREAIDAIDRCVYWNNMTMAEVAELEIKERYGCDNIPDIFFDYFDYEKYARSYLEPDNYYEWEGGVLYVR